MAGETLALAGPPNARAEAEADPQSWRVMSYHTPKRVSPAMSPLAQTCRWMEPRGGDRQPTSPRSSLYVTAASARPRPLHRDDGRP